MSFTIVEVAAADTEPPNDVPAVLSPFKENYAESVPPMPPSKSDLHEVPTAAVVETQPGTATCNLAPIGSSLAQAVASRDTDSNKHKQSRTVRVCVLASSYVGSDASCKEYDDYVNTPAYWFPPECNGVLMNGKGEVVPTTLNCMTHAGPVAASGHGAAVTDGASVTDNGGVTASVNPLTVVSPHAASVFGDGTAYSFDTVMVEKKNSFSLIARLVASGKYDCFFNLCDGARDEDRAGVDVIDALEHHRVPFTGARSKYFEWDKLTMKAAARANGIPTPRCAVIYAHEAESILDTPHALESKVASLRYPLLFKHPSGYGSVGMSKLSKCNTLEALRDNLRPFLQQYQSALIEEFITGDEATVLVCEDARSVDTGGVRVYAPVMCDFGPDAFRHFDMKMETDGVPMGWVPMPPDHPAYGDLVRHSRRAFLAMSGGKGYCRVDWRIRDAAGNFEVQFLEVNPNCGLCYPPSECYSSADYVLSLDAKHGGGGSLYFLQLQIENAIAETREALPAFFEQFVAAEMGFGLFAARGIAAGELVVDHNVGGGGCDAMVSAKPAPLAVFTSVAAAQDFATTSPDITKSGAVSCSAGRIWALNPAATAALTAHAGAPAGCGSSASDVSSTASGAADDSALALFGVLTGPGALVLGALHGSVAGNLCFPHTIPTLDANGTSSTTALGARLSFVAARDIRCGERLMLDGDSLRKRCAVLPLAH